MRLYNERLVLSLIRLHGQLPKAEMARLTGLSAQTVSVIVRQLEADGLLKRRTPQRGKVGQPLVPFELDPEGAFAIGLKVGRRSGDLMLLDLAGNVRHTIHQPYMFPSPEETARLREVGRGGADLGAFGPAAVANFGARHRCPLRAVELGGRSRRPPRRPDGLEGLSILRPRSDGCSHGPSMFCNDASAACAAELLFGQGRDIRDFAYFYIGYFIGGGIVLNGSLFLGTQWQCRCAWLLSRHLGHGKIGSS